MLGLLGQVLLQRLVDLLDAVLKWLGLDEISLKPLLMLEDAEQVLVNARPY